ncbi:DnaJ-domain-containing protein [Aulographum hederae CBS 113979]|uniref:DnaJ-domain-containing protein n=1 Tax=Aulographum hederae CBS 113979 TaxID=1176131 RepID=A0A6G1H5L6_9PEZI|nr:DnaJ-domain-containing protein [Aulographum hederae CBS 113979]
MGANQSSNGGASGAQQSTEVKTSYYELLGIERQATEEEVKKAYRKKALELHPDRNYGDVESATKLFAEVQSAYEVLSDPQERAWYDSHESAILRGDDPDGTEQPFEHNIRITTADEVTRILGKFNRNIIFSDAPSGFYGFLRETFATLAKEEEAAADWEGRDITEYPSFGHKDDTYEGVVKSFYATWSGFVTAKTFAWKDLYRYADAPDRRYRRAMEKENKKLRDEGIREFNEAVRTLVAFVKKRDPRYMPNTITDAERAKVLKEQAAAQRARARAANEAKLREVVPEWTKTREPEETEETEEEEIEEEHYECVACHKTFKSEKQCDAHEKSKKHQKAVQVLQRKMRKDNKNLDLDGVTGSAAGSSVISDEDAERVGDSNDQTDDEHSMGEDELQGSISNLKVDVDEEEKSDEQASDHNQAGLDDAVEDSNEPSSESVQESDQDSDYAPREDVEGRLASKDSTVLDKETAPDSEASAPSPAEPKMGKAAQKRAKRAAQQAAADQEEMKFKCATCNTAFPSKTRMFQHVKDFGHATPVTVAQGGKGGKKGKR